MKKLIASLLVSMGFLLAMTSAVGVSAELNDLNFSVRRIEGALVLRAPVVVELVIVNNSTDTKEVDLGIAQKALLDFAISKSGETSKRFLYPVMGGLSRIGWVKVPGGGQLRKSLLVNEWYPSLEVGKYEIRLSGNLRVRNKGEIVPIRMETNAIAIDILPFDSAKLDAVAKNLRDIALGKSDAEAAADAALALSLIGDPTAVPYLSEVLREGIFSKSLAARGLQDIRSPLAVDALIQASKDKRGETAEISRSALQGLMSRDLPADMRATISSALAASQ